MKKEKTLTTEEKSTINYYDQHAQEWSLRHSGGAMFNPEMKRIFELIPEGKIIEVGVGHGEDARKLIKHYGLENYFGCEPAEGLLERAKKNNPNAKLLRIPIYEIEDIGRRFDGFWISAMMIHIPKNKLKKALRVLHNVIKKGGIGFVSIMEGNADMEESRPGRHYSLWSKDKFDTELENAGFKIVESRKIETKASPWLTYILKTM